MLENRTVADEERISSLEEQLKEFTFMAEDADRKYDEVDRSLFSCMHIHTRSRRVNNVWLILDVAFSPPVNSLCQKSIWNAQNQDLRLQKGYSWYANCTATCLTCHCYASLLYKCACACVVIYFSFPLNHVQATQKLATAEDALSAAEKRVEDAEE